MDLQGWLGNAHAPALATRKNSQRHPGKIDVDGHKAEATLARLHKQPDVNVATILPMFRPFAPTGVTMKLRIYGDSLRLRLSPDNIKQLLETGSVRETTAFGNNNELVYCLCLSSTAREVVASFSAGNICVQMPKDLATKWALTEEVGICVTQPAGDDRSLQISVEKDFQCLDPSKDEPGTVLYPNPRSA